MTIVPKDRTKARRVLVADDEAALAKAIGVRLSKRGYKVDFAHDGATAMMKAVQNNPDLIVLDFRMPAGDGLTVCERLRNNPATWDIPVIILTAHVNDQLRRDAKRVGVKFLLQKPYRAPQLMACIDEALLDVA